MVAYDQDGHDLGPGRVGKPLPSVAVKIVDESGETLPAGETGEIVMTGPSQAPGYEGNPEKVPHTFQDGWVFTGDLGLLDPNGTVAVIGRMSETVRLNGKPVYPSVVQNAVTDVPGVRECAVVGLPPAAPTGILVYVVARHGETVTGDAVRKTAATAAGCDAGQVSVRFEADLPHTPAGKVDIRTLAKMAETD